jgi:hypothetical protein
VAQGDEYAPGDGYAGPPARARPAPSVPPELPLGTARGFAGIRAIPGPVDTGAAQADGVLETTRARVRAGTEWIARGIDGWFGDSADDGERRVSSGRIHLRTLWREDLRWDLTARFNVRLDLPNAREKAYILIGRENERELVTDRPDAFSRQQQLLEERRSDRSLFVGLGLLIRENIDLRVGVRGGYKVYTQARYGHLWRPSDRDRIEFRETLFWTIADGIGSTTALSYDHAFSPSLALRWLTAGTVSQRTDGLAWSSSVGLYQGFGELRMLSLETLVNGEPARRVGVAEYGVLAKWVQPIHRDWLLGELIVGHFWPRQDAMTARGRSWAVGTGVELRF